VQIVYATNLYYAAGYFVRIHDQELAAALYARIAEAVPDFDPQKTYAVDIYGSRQFVTNYPRPPSSTLGFSYFEWGDGTEERMLDYMRLIGYTNLREPPADQRRQHAADFKQMSVWPSRGSVRLVGDTILIKLGANAGAPYTP
jgi:hypothetical protein